MVIVVNQQRANEEVAAYWCALRKTLCHPQPRTAHQEIESHTYRANGVRNKNIYYLGLWAVAFPGKNRYSFFLKVLK
jgi:hypothetical protein